MWSDEDDQIIGGDLTAALAYVTPAGGAVVTPVSPLGLRDREAKTVEFTNSLGFGRKLKRIKENPRVALAFHAREHGFATQPRYVLVQGIATFDPRPDPLVIAERVLPAMTPFMGPQRTGLFWDVWFREHYFDRVVVTIQAGFKANTVGLEVRQHTGWLQDGVYAPHTENGFRAPANKTLTLLGLGMMARRGRKQLSASEPTRPRSQRRGTTRGGAVN